MNKIELFKLDPRHRSPDGSVSIMCAIFCFLHKLTENMTFKAQEQMSGISDSSLQRNFEKILKNVSRSEMYLF